MFNEKLYKNKFNQAVFNSKNSSQHSFTLKTFLVANYNYDEIVTVYTLKKNSSVYIMKKGCLTQATQHI